MHFLHTIFINFLSLILHPYLFALCSKFLDPPLCLVGIVSIRVPQFHTFDAVDTCLIPLNPTKTMGSFGFPWLPIGDVVDIHWIPWDPIVSSNSPLFTTRFPWDIFAYNFHKFSVPYTPPLPFRSLFQIDQLDPNVACISAPNRNMTKMQGKEK